MSTTPGLMPPSANKTRASYATTSNLSREYIPNSTPRLICAARWRPSSSDVDQYLAGKLAPVFFGSALNTFGVKELLDCFVKIAPSPRPVEAIERRVDPQEPGFSGFVFKIHANMDPNHRSCIAFVKVCSGKFERNAPYKQIRTGKVMRFAAPTAFMAQKKSIVDEAYPGDIVGIPDTGNFKIGDTLTEGEEIHYKGLPSFSPEMFMYIENADPMKAKQLEKGIQQLMDEGVAQQGYRHCRPASIRSNTIPPAARIRSTMPMGTDVDVQSLLDRERGCRRARSLQETQAPVYGSRPRRPRRVPGRFAIRADNGAERLSQNPIQLLERKGFLARLSAEILLGKFLKCRSCPEFFEPCIERVEKGRIARGNRPALKLAQ